MRKTPAIDYKNVNARITKKNSFEYWSLVEHPGVFKTHKILSNNYSNMYASNGNHFPCTTIGPLVDYGAVYSVIGIIELHILM